MARLPTQLDTVLPRSNAPVASLQFGNQDQAALTRASLAADGAEAIAGGLDKVSLAFRKLQDLDDKRLAKNDLNTLSQQIRNIMYGDGTDQNPGFMNLQGDNALAARQGTIDALNKAREAGIANAKNGNVKRMYADASAQLLNPELDNVSQHSAKQHAVAFKATSDATIDEAINRAAASWKNQQVLDQSLFVVGQEAANQADFTGIKDPKAKQAAVTAAQTGVLKAVIKNAALNDVDGATALFMKYKDKIGGADQADIEQDLLVAQRVKQAQEDHALAMADRAEKKANDAAFNNAAQLLVQHKLTGDMIMNMEHLDGRDRLTLANGLEQQAKTDATFVGNDSTFFNLLQKVNLPAGDPNRITDRQQILPFVGAKDGISWEDYTHLSSELEHQNGSLADKQRSNFFDSVKAMMVKSNPLLGIRDPDGEQHYIEWFSHAAPAWDKAIADGKVPSQLTDPKSPDYLGKDVQTYLRSPQAVLQDIITQNLGPQASRGGQAVPPPGSPAPAPANNAPIPTISTQAEYEQLPPGASYNFKDASGKVTTGLTKKIKQPANAVPSG